jgi:hypothetical protein
MKIKGSWAQGTTKGIMPMRAFSPFQASSSPSVLRLVDLIAMSDSAETAQNSEPSIAVNPLNAAQMFAATFGAGGANPYFVSTDAGATWSIFGTLDHSDTSSAWKTDGSAVVVATMIGSPDFGPLDTRSVTVPGGSFVAPINHYVGSNLNDQPWLRTGPSNHVYVAFNDLGQFNPPGNGRTASVNVSTDGGSTYSTVTLDRVGGSAPGAGQDDPAVRVAVNGNRVYAVFDRWTSTVENGANGSRFGSQLVVVRSDNGGADGFTALGAGGNGVTAAAHTGVFSGTQNTVLTIGQERIAGGDLAIAVDPNNPDHVVVAYTNAPGPNGAGVVRLVVTESTDGGATWDGKFETPSSTRSGQPGVAILANGAIGLLYNNYDPATDRLSQHLLTTTNDFVSTTDITLASESNATPTLAFDPYIGDFFTLTGSGTAFYGIFSASNADNGTAASFMNVTFNRRFTGTPGTSNFQLVDAMGNAVASSIDPFFFSYVVLNAPPPPAATANMVLRNAGAPPGSATYEIYNLGNNSILAAYWLGQVGTDWGFVTLGGFNDGDTSDMLLRNSSSGAFQVYNVAPNDNNITGSVLLGTVGLEWEVGGFGNFSGLGETDMILRDSNSGGLQVYDIKNNQIIGSAFMGAVGLNWQFSGIGNFSGRGTSDMLLRDANTGELQAYNINSNQITGSAFIGTVGPEWQFSGVGNFSSVPGESDLLLRNSSTGGLQVYNINNDQLTGTAFIGTVGLDWQFAGVAPVRAAGASDLVLRNINTGAFQVYNIANNQITGSAPLGTVGLEWQLGGFAPSSPTGAMGSSDAASNAQLVQAMATFGDGSGGAEGLNAAPLGADTSQQTFLTTPQHA